MGWVNNQSAFVTSSTRLVLHAAPPALLATGVLFHWRPAQRIWCLTPHRQPFSLTDVVVFSRLLIPCARVPQPSLPPFVALRYTNSTVRANCEDICETIKKRVKEECYIPRYKLVCQVALGEMKDQGVRVTSRCLWDPDSDNYASAYFKNVSIVLCRVMRLQ